MTIRTALLASLIGAFLGADARAQVDWPDGAAAFGAQDFAAARTLWEAEANTGSARARFGLGLLYDLGLGVGRDPVKAMRWYLESAEQGLPKAQFNVGVMLDAGTGGTRSVEAAAIWYARAAASGHRRAQYNLGLLYAQGDGVPQNPDVAAFWLAAAAEELPAAADQLAGLPEVDEGVLTAPLPLAEAMVSEEGPLRAELVWSAPPQPAGSVYVVELRAADRQGLPVEITETTSASATAIPLPEEGRTYFWRVSSVDATAAAYESSPWRRLEGGEVADPAPMAGQSITIRTREFDIPALRLGREIAESFRAAGLRTHLSVGASSATQTTVAYAFERDASLARDVAAFLPVLRQNAAAFGASRQALPGNITVDLVGGTAE
ncbi:tetratricopeptide repeat protein [Algicella marina]|uniref:Fibronectin type-III domain-containing protein n=1 Tax=Algicella marina TaxID=2683284 RepID=A0A6P1T1Z8_9RHOB|nr:fibronectin type III domain-containing protein [Algicella marina]QHQ35319.1 hypothetical protein GO499_08960 [Algicella marina]